MLSTEVLERFEYQIINIASNHLQYMRADLKKSKIKCVTWRISNFAYIGRFSVINVICRQIICALKIFNRKTLDPLTLSSIFNFEQKSIHYPDFQIFKPYFKTDPFIKILRSMSHIFLAEPLSRSIHVTQQPEPASGLAFMRALQHPLDTVP